jgi:hypothetical protein
MTIARFKDDKELVAFARKFFANRVETFRKDIAICLTPNERGQHAYFPALIICIAFAELLSGLYAGTLRDQKLVQLQEYAKEFMKPEYTSDRRRLELLWVCLRHKVAHLAYPYAVFDTHSEPKTILHGQPRRRVTWSIHETEQRPAIEINDCPPQQLVKTPTPWLVSYDCRIEVSVRSLAIDIVWSIERYLQGLQSNPKTRENFDQCMEDYFPRDFPLNESPPG